MHSERQERAQIQTTIKFKFNGLEFQKFMNANCYQILSCQSHTKNWVSRDSCHTFVWSTLQRYVRILPIRSMWINFMCGIDAASMCVSTISGCYDSVTFFSYFVIVAVVVVVIRCDHYSPEEKRKSEKVREMENGGTTTERERRKERNQYA